MWNGRGHETVLVGIWSSGLQCWVKCSLHTWQQIEKTWPTGMNQWKKLWQSGRWHKWCFLLALVNRNVLLHKRQVWFPRCIWPSVTQAASGTKFKSSLYQCVAALGFGGDTFHTVVRYAVRLSQQKTDWDFGSASLLLVAGNVILLIWKKPCWRLWYRLYIVWVYYIDSRYGWCCVYLQINLFIIYQGLEQCCECQDVRQASV